MLEASKDLETLNKAIKVCKLPEKFRTAEEVNILSRILSQFDIFPNKVSSDQLPQVLRAAAMNIKFMKVPMGQFLYHKDEPSKCIYFILKGEAWKFRPKTESELERESQVVKNKRNQPVGAVPKILETIRLAKASKERDLMSLNQIAKENLSETGKPQTVSSINMIPYSQATIPSFLNTSQVLDKIVDNPSLENSLDTSRSQEGGNENKGEGKSNKNKDEPHLKMNFNTIIKKIMSKRDVLNFENDYFYNLVKRTEELAFKYIRDSLLMMRFERKIYSGETVGELSMSLDCARTSSVLAYTNLYVVYLDQKGYEKVFMNQIEEVREKVHFFVNYFKDIKYDTLKRMCFFFKEQRFKVGETIYKEGSTCNDLYFIKSGEVQLSKTVETEENLVVAYEKDNGSLVALTPEPRKSTKNVIVTSIIDGFFFGEEVLSENCLRKFTAKSISNLVCYKITAKILAKLPKEMIQMLRDFSVSKQEWRGNRLKDITNRSSSVINTNNANVEIPNPRNSTREVETKTKAERQSYPRVVFLDRPLEKQTSPKRQRDSSLEAGPSRSMENVDESLCRFKFQTKSHLEDKNPYVLKFFPQENIQRRQTLSVWRKNVHKKEKSIVPRGSYNERSSISMPKDEYMDQTVVNSKLSARPTKRESFGEGRYELKKSNTESLLNVPKSAVSMSRDDLSHYLIRNLGGKLGKDFIQKTKTVNIDGISTDKKLLEDSAQNASPYKLAPKDKAVQSLNDLKSSGQKSVKNFVVRDPITTHHFAVKSLNNLDNSQQWPSIKEHSFTQKNAKNGNIKPKTTFTATLSQSNSLAQLFTVKKKQNNTFRKD